nr:transposase [Lapillicoccus sp.]
MKVARPVLRGPGRSNALGLPDKSTTGRSTKKSARRARRRTVSGSRSCRSWSTALAVSADGAGVVAHAGNVATRLLADQVGLTGALSGAMARRGFTPTHDRGRVLVDVAVLIAGGGEAIADIDVLRHQGEVLGSVASAPTVWRARHELDEVTPVVVKRIDEARAEVRAHVWSQLPAGLPAWKVADTDLGDVVVLDVDATLVTTLGERERGLNVKRGFGYHPLGVWCINTQESMALMLRPGNAGSDTASDHIAVLTAAIDQVPPAHRKKLLIRADGAGASHGLLDWITGLDAKRGQTVEYSVGYAVTDKVRDAIAQVPKTAWQPAITAQGEPREHGDMLVAVEITGMLNLTSWPAGMQVLIRREHPHPGASLSLFEDADGWRYQAVATNTPTSKGGQVAFLEARHRAHAMHQHVETRIRHAKDSRHRPIPLPRICHQPGLDLGCVDRRGPHRLASATGPTARVEGVRTESAAVPVPSSACPPHPRRPSTPPALPPDLALGPRDRRRLRRDPRARRDPVPDLRASPSPIRPRPAPPGDPPRSATRQTSMPTATNPNHATLTYCQSTS